MARPRKRSEEETLQICLQEFWRRGYAATSISDLCEVLGVGPSSLYNAFGSKEQIYERALEQYARDNSAFVQEALDRPHVIDALLAVLEGATNNYRRKDCPGGCAILAASCIPDERLDAAVRAKRKSTLAALEQRALRGAEDQQLTASVDPRSLAAFVFCMMQGLSQEARDGCSQAHLQKVVQTARPVLEAARA